MQVNTIIFFIFLTFRKKFMKQSQNANQNKKRKALVGHVICEKKCRAGH